MTRARRLAGLPPPDDDLVIISNNKSSYSSKLAQPIKKIIVSKNLKSKKSSRISVTPTKVPPLIKKEDVMRSHQEVDYESNRNMKEKEKRDNDNSLNIDNEELKGTQNFQVPITPASKVFYFNYFNNSIT
jgi:hypothetical protein